MKRTENEGRIIWDYITCELTNPEIIEKHHICPRTLHKVLKRNNIPLKIKRIPHIKQNYINTQILYGSLLGDGGVTNRNIFSEGHGIKQEPYLRWKNSYLKLSFGYHVSRSGKSESEQCHIYSSRNDPWCKELREEFYPSGIKVVTRDILDKIEPLGLLIWYLDDGHYKIKNYTTLATHCFTYNEHLIMKKYFKDRWNINVTIYPLNKIIVNRNFLRFSVLETKKLLNIIQPIFKEYELPECMVYKLWK